MTRRRVNISLIANCIAMSAVSRIRCWIWALKRRCGSDLYADGTGSGGGNAGLRPHRRGAFGDLRGFSPEAVAGRIIDSSSRLVITADEGVRAGRSIPLKKNVDDALKNPNVTSVEHVIVLKRTGSDIDWQEGRDLWWRDLIEKASPEHQPEAMNAEDPLFILYTSGSTGKPKGVLHTTGGYLVYAATTFKYVFDYHRRYLLVYRRCGLGDGAQLSVVWPAGAARPP